MTERAPEVTVVIPTRNRSDFLRRSLDSALSQEDVSLEVIVIDDCSSDGTQAYLASLSDQRVRVLRQPERSGVSLARNRGISATRGKWIAFLDDDDAWLPQRLRKTIDVGTSAGADFVYGEAVALETDGTVVERPPSPRPQDMADALRQTNAIVSPSALIVSAELVERAGGFDPELAYLADWDIWIRFAAIGKPARCADLLVQRYRHEGSMMFDWDVSRELAWFRRKHPQVQMGATSLRRWMAGEARAQGRRWAASRAYLREGSPSSMLRAVAVLFGERAMYLGSRSRHWLLRRRSGTRQS